MENLMGQLRDLLPGVGDERLKIVVQLVKSAVGRMGGRPKNTPLTHVESDAAKGVIPVPTKPVISTLLISGSESGSSLTLIPGPDLSKPLISKRESDEPAGFLEFWALYPNKVGKGAARLSWIKHRPPIVKVRAALAWQRRSLKWQQGYVPNPATWINQSRWEDEPPVNLKAETAAAPKPTGLCAFHFSLGNANDPSPRGHDEACSECRHVKALRNPRGPSEPTAVGGTR